MELVENSGKYKINAITDCSNTDLTLLQCSQVKICSHMQEVLDTLDNGLNTNTDEWYNNNIHLSEYLCPLPEGILIHYPLPTSNYFNYC